MYRDIEGNILADDCPCPTPFKREAYCPDCPNRAVSWCEHCGSAADTYFDRTECPEPCGTMHDRCKKCSYPVDYCELEDEDD